MKLLRIAAVGCWALALVPTIGTSAEASSSPTLDAYGWWNKAQALPVQGDPTGLGLPELSVPAPPTVPEDGLYVSNEASGPAAFAAVRYRAGGGQLTLALAEGSALTGAEELAACKVPGGFQPAQNGRWEAAPAYEEEGCTEAVAAEDGTTLTFEAPASWASSFGDISLAIVPTPGSATPFSLAFTAPTDASFVGSGAPSSTPSSFSPSSSPASSSFAPSKPSAFAAPSTPSVASPPVVEDEVASAPVPVPAATNAAVTTPASSDTAKWVAMGLLVAIGAGLWVLSSKQARAPRLLGSIGSGATAAPAPVAATDRRPRGVGRFARPRSAPPTAI